MELKWKYLDELYREKYFDKDVPPVYLKSEADKVIAELEKKLDIYKRGWMENDKVNANQYAEIRHHKYKRCLAMAEACMHKRWRPDEGFDYARSTRHMKKWLELADKFKETK